MTRVDMKNREVTNLTPSAADLSSSMEGRVVPDPEQGPITTAASYGKRVEARRQKTASLKGRSQPLGGAPPIEPGKLSQLMGMSTMAQPTFDGSPPDEPPPEPLARQPMEPPVEEHPPIPGVGSAYVVNQQVTRGETEGPVSMRQAKEMAQEQAQRAPQKPLSKESIEALERAKREAEAAEEETPTYDPGVDTTGAELDAAEKDMGIERNDKSPFDFGDLARNRSILATEKRREEIESRLGELKIEDIIINREIAQDIPVIPGKLVYRLRTFNQQENFFCMQYTFDHPGSGMYVEEMFNFSKLVCSVVSINGAMLPEHRVHVGEAKEEVDRDAFERKMAHLRAFPVQLMADLSLQAIWFNDRVNGLFSLDNLKNG